MAALAGIAVVAYLPAVSVGFLSDDYETIGGVRAAAGIGDILTRHDLIQGTGSTFFRPLWMLLNWLIYQIFGNNALPFHLVNLGLYALSTILVWVIVRRLVGERLAWLVATAFALYPRHAEAVVWIGASTDVLATTLALAALAWMLCIRSPILAAVGSTVLAGAAAMTKESTFPLPVLALLVLWIAVPGPGTPREMWRRWTPLAMLGLDFVLFVLRYKVLGGLGGYSPHSVTPGRVVEALGSLAVAAFTPAQLEILRQPVFVLVPLAVLALAGWGVWALIRSGDRLRLRIFSVGVAWVVVSFLPLYNSAVNLNTAEGERLLLLPSVGLLLAAVALIPPRLRLTPARIAGPVVLGGALCLLSAQSYVEATHIADRVVAEAQRLAPARGQLLLLSFPEAYRNADLLASGLQAALGQSGHGAVHVIQCLPVLVRSTESNQTAFVGLSDGSFAGTTTWAAPFVFRQSQAAADQCSYTRTSSGPIGLGLSGNAVPPPSVVSSSSAVVVYFDGSDLRACRVTPSAGPAAHMSCP